VASDRIYSAAQIAQAATELRAAAGAGDEFFSGEQVVNMLAEEIRLLRERGFTDQRIADLLTGFDIDVSADDIARGGTADTQLL
jgi:hypothetical protein